jgi:hypothetical protein
VTLEPVPGSGEDYTLAPGKIVQVSREIQQEFYGGDGLKTGHHKEVYGLVDRGSFFGLGVSVEPIRLMTETCSIKWDVHPDDPSQMIQVRNFTEISGLIYEGERTDTRGGKDVRVRYPVNVAQNSPGVIKDDGRDVLRPNQDYHGDPLSRGHSPEREGGRERPCVVGYGKNVPHVTPYGYA